MRYDTGNESHYETVALQANSWIFRNETNICREGHVGLRLADRPWTHKLIGLRMADMDLSAFGWPTGLKYLPRASSSVSRAVSLSLAHSLSPSPLRRRRCCCSPGLALHVSNHRAHCFACLYLRVINQSVFLVF